MMRSLMDAQREYNRLQSQLLDSPEYWYKRPSRWQRFRAWLAVIGLRWRWRRGNMNAYTPERIAPIVEEQRVREYAPATTPAPWTEDIAAHNRAVNVQYDESVMALKTAWLVGSYQPRYFLSADGCMRALAGERDTDTVNWDLEMTLNPGARVDVTHATEKRFKRLTGEEIGAVKIEQGLRGMVSALEHGHVAKTPRQAVGTREEILRACEGNAQRADQVEQAARDLFGVEDLDAPITRRAHGL